MLCTLYKGYTNPALHSLNLNYILSDNLKVYYDLIPEKALCILVLLAIINTTRFLLSWI